MIHIGLSGWDSRSLYAAGIRASDKLEIYSSIYSTVEVNSTFYSFPSPKTIETWYQTVPAEFRFSVKINRLFSHESGLLLTRASEDRLTLFLSGFSLLREKLSWFLLQLPPSFSRDQAALSVFLAAMRRIMSEHGMDCGIAVEFRHRSWYQDETRRILQAAGAVQVISSSPGGWPCVWVRDQQSDYLRLHGLKKMYHTPYRAEELTGLKQWLDGSGAPSSWIYFDNTATAGARDNSQFLMDLFGQPVPEQTRQLTMDLFGEPDVP